MIFDCVIILNFKLLHLVMADNILPSQDQFLTATFNHVLKVTRSQLSSFKDDMKTLLDLKR
jgi:hypothetical protein